MRLIDHVSIAVKDLERARRFYDAIFAVLDAVKVYDRKDAIGYGERNGSDDDAHSYLSIYLSATAAADPRGRAGLRPNYHPAYYAAFLIDP
ncbi:MAG TPA: hypothetical protein VFZ84_16400 [Burkholderiales bacterium]